jgi:DnaJ-domain-containing protein 1
MQLQLTPYCIHIHLSPTSIHALHVKKALTQTFERSFWIDNVLINFALEHELNRRKAFLASLYHVCAKMSHSQNHAFFQKLMLESHKPIRLLIKHSKRHTVDTTYNTLDDPYRLLDAHKKESLESIRKKYLRLVKIYHPDRVVSQDTTKRQDCTAKFQQIQEAYQAIKIEKMKRSAA